MYGILRELQQANVTETENSDIRASQGKTRQVRPFSKRIKGDSGKKEKAMARHDAVMKTM